MTNRVRTVQPATSTSQSSLRTGGSLLALAMCAFATPGLAQSAPATTAANDPQATSSDVELGEVVVTAQRRGERLQDVPIAVSAVTANTLAASSIDTTARLSQAVPAVTFTRIGASVLPRIRGVGNSITAIGTENSVSTYIDGVYVPSITGSLLTLNNIERVEVLKGPQGTLFGRNATGGLIQIVTRDPGGAFRGEANFGYGNYDTKTGSFYLGGGLSDTLALDISGVGRYMGDGYGRNLFYNVDANKVVRDHAIRSKLVWRPTGAVTLKLTGDYSQRKDFGYVAGPLSGYPLGYYTPTATQYKGSPAVYGGPHDIDSNVIANNNIRSTGFSGELRVDAGFADIVNILGYRRTKSAYTTDTDAGPKSVLEADIANTERMLSNETQLVSHSGGKLDWVMGLYLYRNRYRNDRYKVFGAVFGGAIYGTGRLNSGQTESIAGYGQATYEFLPATRLTVGLRYTDEKRDGTYLTGTFLTPTTSVFGAPTHREYDNHRLTFRFALDHKFTPDVLGYLSYNRGFKSGGFNLAGAVTNPPYNPEILDSYEAGLKTELLDHRVRFNTALFLYKYTNLQVTQFTSTSTQVITNGARATMWGIDSDVETRLNRTLTVRGNLSYLHSNFDSYPGAPFYILNTTAPNYLSTFNGDATDNTLPYAPTLTFNIGADQVIPSSVGNFTLSGNFYHSSGWFGEPNNQIKERPYSIVNASLGWTSNNEMFSARLWANNLLDKDYNDQITVVASTSVLRSPAPPRTYGVTFGVKF